MSPTYYDRELVSNSDGTPLFATTNDARQQSEVAEVCARVWSCELRAFGHLCPIDHYAERHGRLVGLVEIKCRTHDAMRYASVFLNVRKWLALSLGAIGLGVPALFVVRFTDEMRWIDVAAIIAPTLRIAGCTRRVKSHTDIEPVIEVDVASMHLLYRGS